MESINNINKMAENNELRACSEFLPDDALTLEGLVKKHAGDAVAYHMGNVESFINLKGPEHITWLPHPVCWFELDYICTNSDPKRRGKKEQSGYLCIQNDAGSLIYCVAIVKQAGKDWLISGVRGFNKLGNGKITLIVMDVRERAMDLGCQVVATFLKGLECKTV